eukprot:15452830-Alexandrium_andersonii.AAC.1
MGQSTEKYPLGTPQQGVSRRYYSANCPLHDNLLGLHAPPKNFGRPTNFLMQARLRKQRGPHENA